MAKRKFAVLGNPVAHSRSPEIHQDFARQTGKELSYEKVLVPTGKFREVAMEFLGAGGAGFNVTLPCKGDAFAFVNHKSGSASKSRAVNTVSVDSNGQIHGDNTDGPGLVRDLVHNLDWQIEEQRILVLGAGGAVRGILWDLLQASPRYLHLYNRTLSKALVLTQQMADVRMTTVDMGDLEDGYDLVINGTSAGLSGMVPSVPKKVLGKHSRCYDLVYGPGVTVFNNWCRQISGCEVADGMGMLVEQAALSFHLWFSEEVHTRELISTLRKTGLSWAR